MFSRLLKNTSNLTKVLTQTTQASFSGRSGPYNPYKYKEYLVPRNMPTNEEIYAYMRSVHSVPTSPVRNLRHINPVR